MKNLRVKKEILVENWLICVDLESGKGLWKAVTPGGPAKYCAPNTPCIKDGKVYYVNSRMEVMCVDAINGNIIWRTLTGTKNGIYSGSVIVIDDKVIVPDKKIMAFNITTGEKIWEVDIDCGYFSPALWSADSKSFIIAGSVEVICVEPDFAKVFMEGN